VHRRDMVDDLRADRGGVAAVAWELTGAATARQPLRRGRCRCGGSACSSTARRCFGTCAKGGRGNELGCPRRSQWVENRESGGSIPEQTLGLGHGQNEREGSPFIAAHRVRSMRSWAERASTRLDRAAARRARAFSAARWLWHGGSGSGRYLT
jgi:hypothetical protein